MRKLKEFLAAWPRAVIAAVALVVSIVGFGWTLCGYFVGDDFGYVGRFYELPLGEWPRLFVSSWAGDMWGFQLRELRPITALSFMIDGRLWGGNAVGYRVANLGLHALSATLVGWLAWRAADRALVVGAAAAGLFALHPAHAEPVQWITGRVDVLATLFYLAGFAAFVKYRTTERAGWLAAFAGLSAAAAFSKEFGLTLPVMCMVADLVWRPGGRHGHAAPLQWGRLVVPYAVSVGFVVIYFYCRRTAFGPGGVGAGMPAWTSAAFHEQLAQRQLTYIGHLFPPAERWFFEGAPALKEGALRRFLWILGGAVVVGALWRWAARWESVERRRAAMFFVFGWYAVATLPLIVTYISARHLYLASAGVCVAAALLLQAVLRNRIAVALATVAIGVFFVPRLKLTMGPWHEAAVVSGKITAEVRRLAPELVPGAALLMDVPEIRQGAYVWTWAIPFVMRPPFIGERLDEKVVVLESRGQYVDWDRWHEQPAIAKLREVTAPSWIVHHSEEKPLHRIPVRVERIRPAVEKFAAGKLKEDPHGEWRKLVDALAGN